MLLTWEEYSDQSSRKVDLSAIKIKTEFFKDEHSDKWFNVTTLFDAPTQNFLVVQNYCGGFTNISKKNDVGHIRNSVRSLIKRKKDEGYVKKQDAVTVFATSKSDAIFYLETIETTSEGLGEIGRILKSIDRLPETDEGDAPSPLEAIESDLNVERLKMNSNWGSW